MDENISITNLMKAFLVEWFAEIGYW